MSTYSWLVIASKLIMLFIIFAVAYLVDYMVKNEIIQKQYSKMQGRGKQFLTENMKRAKGKSFNYEYMDAFINKYGVNFMIKGITPVGYVALKLIASVFVMVVTMHENVVLGLAFGPACYYILDFIFIESNKSDNKLMLEDIKNVYDTLRIQIKAGVYITYNTPAYVLENGGLTLFIELLISTLAGAVFGFSAVFFKKEG